MSSMSKKILIIAVTATVLIAVLIFFAILAPGSRGDNNDDTNTTTPPNTPADSGSNTPADTSATNEVVLGIPEDTDFNKLTVTLLVDSSATMKEFFYDEVDGDRIGAAIHDRNMRTEDALGVTLNYVEEVGGSSKYTSFNKVVENDIKSGDCEYDIIAAYSRALPILTLNGAMTDLTTVEYLDLDQPYWPETLISECTVNDKLFYCSGDISTNLLWMMSGTFFNKSMLAASELESPYDLVDSNRWTLDKAIEMATDRYEDVDGAGTKDAADKFGYVMYDINFDAFFNGAGFVTITKNSTGELSISDDLTDQRLYTLIEKLGSFFNSTDAFFKSDISVREIFFEERALFITDRVFIAAGKDNGKQLDKIEFEYGLVPQPKLYADQQSFVTNVGHPFMMYGISSGIKDETLIDACGATLETLGYWSYKLVTPEVFEEAMKYKYASDEVTSRMYDILRSTVVFDLGRFYTNQVGDAYKAVRGQITSGTNKFASQFKSLQKMMRIGIETISAAYED